MPSVATTAVKSEGTFKGRRCTQVQSEWNIRHHSAVYRGAALLCLDSKGARHVFGINVLLMNLHVPLYYT